MSNSTRLCFVIVSHLYYRQQGKFSQKDYFYSNFVTEMIMNNILFSHFEGNREEKDTKSEYYYSHKPLILFIARAESCVGVFFLSLCLFVI